MVLRKLLSLASLFESKIFIVQRSIEIVNFTEHMMLDLHLPTLRLYVRYKSDFKISQRYLHFLKVTSDTSLQEKRTKARFQSESENSLTSSWHFYEIYKLSGIKILFFSSLAYDVFRRIHASRKVRFKSVFNAHNREALGKTNLDKKPFHSPKSLHQSFSLCRFHEGIFPWELSLATVSFEYSNNKQKAEWSKKCFW